MSVRGPVSSGGSCGSSGAAWRWKDLCTTGHWALSSDGRTESCEERRNVLEGEKAPIT